MPQEILMLDGRRLLTTKDVLDYTGYGLRTIYRAVALGQLQTARPRRKRTAGNPRSHGGPHRFRLRDVDTWITTA